MQQEDYKKRKISNSNVDLLLPTNETNYILKNSDYIVLSCPLTPKTYKLINKKILKNIKNSIIINISRGDVIDEKSLIVALQKIKLGGAALDVFSKTR